MPRSEVFRQSATCLPKYRSHKDLRQPAECVRIQRFEEFTPLSRPAHALASRDEKLGERDPDPRSHGSHRWISAIDADRRRKRDDLLVRRPGSGSRSLLARLDASAADGGLRGSRAHDRPIPRRAGARKLSCRPEQRSSGAFATYPGQARVRGGVLRERGRRFRGPPAELFAIGGRKANRLSLAVPGYAPTPLRPYTPTGACCFAFLAST